MYDINADNIGKKIRYYRKAKNMSAEELGQSIGKNRTTINRYENNEIYYAAAAHRLHVCFMRYRCRERHGGCPHHLRPAVLQELARLQEE